MSLGVGGGHRSYIPSLRVRYGREIQSAGRSQQVRVYPHPFGSQTLEVSQLQLDGRRLRLDRLENSEAELPDGPGLRDLALAHAPQDLRRQVAGVRVEAHNDGAPLAVGGGNESVHYGNLAGAGTKKPRGEASRGVKSSAFSLLDGVFKSVAGGELRHLRGRDLHLLFSLGVDALAGLTLLHVELAEAGDLDLVTLLKLRGDHALERVEEALGLTLGAIGLISYLLDQLSFVHVCITSLIRFRYRLPHDWGDYTRVPDMTQSPLFTPKSSILSNASNE